MRVLATQFNANMRSLDIYLAGCKAPHCPGCCNPETWDFDQGDLWNDKLMSTFIKKITAFSNFVKNLMIFGGEPLDNPYEEIVDFLVDLNKFKPNGRHIPIWLFTRRDIEDVPDRIKELCDYVKCGRYVEELTVDNNIQHGIKLATSNQKIYKTRLI